jgi:hypothetical protein
MKRPTARFGERSSWAENGCRQTCYGAPLVRSAADHDLVIVKGPEEHALGESSTTILVVQSNRPSLASRDGVMTEAL